MVGNPSNLTLGHHDGLPAMSMSSDLPTGAWYHHSSGQRVNTAATLACTIRAAYPDFEVTLIPQTSIDLITYADETNAATHELAVDSADPHSKPLNWREYRSSALSPIHGDRGKVDSTLKFGKYSYTHSGQRDTLYVADCRDGMYYYPESTMQYLIHGRDEESQSKVEKLLLEAGEWCNTVRDEVWVFDSAHWSKDKDLWRSITKSRWEDVILDDDEKNAMRGDVTNFFDNRDRYDRYRIAWKRGVIYHGPPGNGKTVSIKALSNELYKRSPQIPTLYVKTFANQCAGPEASIRDIFSKARKKAPCLLIFEDLDSIVTDNVRSYFLNEVDGLNTNSGVYMIGSTNHMDRLDPAISKRPSRFDRKIAFNKPNLQQRTKYSEHWYEKTRSVADGTESPVSDSSLEHVSPHIIEFPKGLAPEIAKITEDFSFAYLQEAFVATMLIILGSHGEEHRASEMATDTTEGKEFDKFDHIPFWRVFKKQVAALKEQID